MDREPPPQTGKPAHIEAALSQLIFLLKTAEKREIDYLEASWREVEKSVVKVLGGAFKLSKQEHQLIALGLAAMLGEKLLQAHKGFWFENQDSAIGVSLGFAEAVIVLSPFEAVLEALSLADLGKLELLMQNVSNSLSAARMASGIPLLGAPKLDASLYERLFNPNFAQLVSVDMEKAEATWKRLPAQLMQELGDLLTRIGSGLPAELKTHMEKQFHALFNAMEPHKALGEQWEKHGQTCELATRLWASVAATGPVSEAFWSDVVFPLLFTGYPETFPPLEEAELEAAKRGVPPFYIFLEVVPYVWPSPEDGALLGAFAKSALSPLSPTPSGTHALRMLRVDTAFIEKPLSAFESEKLQEAVARFASYLKEQVGSASVEAKEKEALGDTETQTVFNSALHLLGELKNMHSAHAKPGTLFVRCLTEAEADVEGAFELIRKSLQGPKLILV